MCNNNSLTLHRGIARHSGPYVQTRDVHEYLIQDQSDGPDNTQDSKRTQNGHEIHSCHLFAKKDPVLSQLVIL